MALAERLALSNRATVARVLNPLGSTVTVVRATDVRNADGSKTRSWSPIADGEGVKMLLSSVTLGKAARTWGEESQVVAQGFVADGPDIQPGDGVIVTKGNRAGSAFLVVPSGVQHDYEGGSRTLGLRTSKTEDFR